MIWLVISPVLMALGNLRPAWHLYYESATLDCRKIHIYGLYTTTSTSQPWMCRDLSHI